MDATPDKMTNTDTPARPFARRSVLRLGGVAAVAGATLSVLGGSDAAGAATGTMRYGATNAAGPTGTRLTSSNVHDALHVTNGGLGDGIVGEATNTFGTGAGVAGSGVGGAGVSGTTRGDGPALRAIVARGARGSAVQAWTTEPDNAAPTIDARQLGTAGGLFAHIDNDANTSYSVLGRTAGRGPGVEGTSAQGVGGRFAGATAQLQLIPSSAPVHPARGSAGDLFLDRSHRLWFCKGGADWRQLA
jgi:hypothetical protein